MNCQLIRCFSIILFANLLALGYKELIIFPTDHPTFIPPFTYLHPGGGGGRGQGCAEKIGLISRVCLEWGVCFIVKNLGRDSIYLSGKGERGW